MAQSSMELQKPGSSLKKEMPDISNNSSAVVRGRLESVGMSKIEMPVMWKAQDGQTFMLPAKIDASVNLLDSAAKGIHMSRLYLILSNTVSNQPLKISSLKSFLKSFVESQMGLSDAAYVGMDFTLPLKRQALKSDNFGWRQYPVALRGSFIQGEFLFELAGTVTYSSTCPCSAALARQLIREKFSLDFKNQERLSRAVVEDWLELEESILATPHSQRSTAEFKVQFSDSEFLPDIVELIDRIEAGLGTAVQAAVKREDEQEFARLNGQNLMFCEDAGRKVKKALKAVEKATGFWVRLTHEESLHPHDAVSIASEGYSLKIIPS